MTTSQGATRQRVAWALCASLPVLIPATAAAQATGDFLLSPDLSGGGGQNLGQNYHTLMADLVHVPDPEDTTDQHAVHRIFIDGELHVTVPWFDSSTECTVAKLNKGKMDDGTGNPVPILPSPTLEDYLMVTDELSELAVAVSLWTDDDLMSGIHRTVQAMRSTDFTGLPCWLARVREDTTPNTIECFFQDTATDGTVRLGLAYYNAAVNPHFPESSRELYRAAGDALALRHLEHEYAHGPERQSGLTLREMEEWIAGGAETALDPLDDGTEMWIGYHQDIALFLLAAHVSTENPVFLDRATDVVDQWLMASEFDGFDLSLGSKTFRWHVATNPLLVNRGAPWDESDAPRALWLAHLLRAWELARPGEPFPSPLDFLSDWVQLLLGNGTQTSTTSCIEYNEDGTPALDDQGQPKNCGDNYYYNGLGAGLLTFHRVSWLETKLAKILEKYQSWDESHAYWDGEPCFGIYRPIRPVKALAAAIGLDAAAYGGRRYDARSLDVQRAGAGAGFLVSDLEGIDCGLDCTGLFVWQDPIELTATPYIGSTFTGWSEAACSGGTVVMDTDTTCTATFEGSCDPLILLENQTVSSTELFAGCDEIRAGNGFGVVAPGDVTLRAGGRIVLTDGFSVGSGARFTATASAEP